MTTKSPQFLAHRKFLLAQAVERRRDEALEIEEAPEPVTDFHGDAVEPETWAADYCGERA